MIAETGGTCGNGEMGRPRIELDWEKVDAMLAYQCTLEEVAAFCGCSEDTIERRVREEFKITFAEYSKAKRRVGLISLRRSSFALAKKNAAMNIFLSKNLLGMRDAIDIPDDSPQDKYGDVLNRLADALPD